MINHDHLLPGLAAILLAVLFPVYWVYILGTDHVNFPAEYYANVLRLDTSDWVYLILGVLEIYIYLSLRNVLHERLNFQGVDILLILSIGNTIIFYVGLFLIDAGIFLFKDNIAPLTQSMLVKISYWISLGCLFIYGLLGLLIGIQLWRHSEHISLLLKFFGITMLVVGLFQLSVVFGFVTIFLFPIALLILAFYFLQKPEIVEVV